MPPSSLMNSAVTYGTQSPVASPNESSKLLRSSSIPAVKGKGKSRSQQEFDLEAQLDGASHSHEHHTRRHHPHETRYGDLEGLIPGEEDDQPELLPAEAALGLGLVGLESDSRLLVNGFYTIVVVLGLAGIAALMILAFTSLNTGR